MVLWEAAKTVIFGLLATTTWRIAGSMADAAASLGTTIVREATRR